MNYKTIVSTICLIGFSISLQAQKLLGTVEALVEQKTAEQRAEEKANPILSKTRPGRIPTKVEKIAMQKARNEKYKKLAEALKAEKGKNGGKMKITTSKDRKIQPAKGTTKQPTPTKATIKKLKIKE